MRINHNIAAINTNRALARNNKMGSSSLEKLSSGQGINRAGDNAAGLAISEKMRGQIRGLDQATNNANDGISLIQTAEGGLNETHNILHRMRELAIQSANDTNTAEDRAEIQKEIDQLTKEITRISTDTEFNTKKLLDGSMLASFDVTESNVGSLSAPLKIMNLDALDSTKTYTGTLSVIEAGEKSFTPGQNPEKINLQPAFDPAAIADGEYTFRAESVDPIGHTTSIAIYKDDINVFTFPGGNYRSNTPLSNAFLANISLNPYLATGEYSEGEVIASFTIATSAESSASVSWQDDDGNVLSDADAAKSFAYHISSNANDGDTITVGNISDQSLTFHVGANSKQNTTFGIPDCSAKTLGVDGLDLTTQSSADAAIGVIDNAIQMVSSVRGTLGAMQNRLEHAINNLGTSSENLSAAESQIRDVDMAEEMSEFTKANILSQAATSMLAQANQQPQNILSLIQQ